MSHARSLHEHMVSPFDVSLHPDGLEDLVRTPVAADWFDRIGAVVDAGAYTFQLPLQGPPLPGTRTAGDELLLFSTYSYAGLAADPRLAAASSAAIERFGTSTGGVRLLSGTITLHRELEQALARFVGKDAAVTYTSGYAANLAVIGALFGPDDTCFIDQIAHESLHTAVRLAGAKRQVFRHNDMRHLRECLAAPRTGRALIIVDGVFSMHGDQAPLAELIALRREFGAFLLVDEAHALAGVGERGRGTWEAQGVDPADIDLITGSLSKGIPASGGFVAGSRQVAVYLQHGSSPFMFSAALPPGSTAVALEALRVLEAEPEHMARLRRNQRLLEGGLRARGFEIGASTSPIVPLVLGDPARAYRWSRELLLRGIYANAVTWPAVGKQQARLRLCATAGHAESDFERLFAALAEIRDAEARHKEAA